MDKRMVEMGLIAEAGYLGDQLIKMGIVTEEQIKQALEFQAQKKKKGQKTKLGQCLIDLGCCSEECIARAMAEKSGFEFMSINKTGIDMACANLITPEIATKYKLLPITMRDSKLIVAMQNPNDIIAIDDIELLTGFEVEPVVVPDRELATVLDQFTNVSKNHIIKF